MVEASAETMPIECGGVEHRLLGRWRGTRGSRARLAQFVIDAMKGVWSGNLVRQRFGTATREKEKSGIHKSSLMVVPDEEQSGAKPRHQGRKRVPAFEMSRTKQAERKQIEREQSACKAE